MSLCDRALERESRVCVCVRERAVCVFIYLYVQQKGREGGIRGAGRDEENERAA